MHKVWDGPEDLLTVFCPTCDKEWSLPVYPGMKLQVNDSMMPIVECSSCAKDREELKVGFEKRNT